MFEGQKKQPTWKCLRWHMGGVSDIYCHSYDASQTTPKLSGLKNNHQSCSHRGRVGITGCRPRLAGLVWNSELAGASSPRDRCRSGRGPRPKAPAHGNSLLIAHWPQQVTCQPQTKGRSWIPSTGRNYRNFYHIYVLSIIIIHIMTDYSLNLIHFNLTVFLKKLNMTTINKNQYLLP